MTDEQITLTTCEICGRSVRPRDTFWTTRGPTCTTCMAAYNAAVVDLCGYARTLRAELLDELAQPMTTGLRSLKRRLKDDIEAALDVVERKD